MRKYRPADLLMMINVFTMATKQFIITAATVTMTVLCSSSGTYCMDDVFSDIEAGQCQKPDDSGVWNKSLGSSCDRNRDCPYRFYCNINNGQCDYCTRATSGSLNEGNPSSNCHLPVPYINSVKDGFQGMFCPPLSSSYGEHSILCSVGVKASAAPLNTVCQLKANATTVYACCSWNTTSRIVYWAFSEKLPPFWISVYNDVSNQPVPVALKVVLSVLVIAVITASVWMIIKHRRCKKQTKKAIQHEDVTYKEAVMVTRSALLLPPLMPLRQPVEGIDNTSIGDDSNPTMTTDNIADVGSSDTSGISSANHKCEYFSLVPDESLTEVRSQSEADITQVKMIDDSTEASIQDAFVYLVMHPGPDHTTNMIGLKRYDSGSLSIDSYQRHNSLTMLADQPQSSSSNRTETTGYDTGSLDGAFIPLPDTVLTYQN